MRAATSSPADLIKVGPPFLHVTAEGTTEGIGKAIADVDDKILVRSFDGNLARDLAGLCRELGIGIQGRPIADNFDALEDVMCDPEWVAGARYPAATIYIIDNAAAVLRDLPLGLAKWGTMVGHWASVWAQPVADTPEVWNRDAIPLHFVHIAERLPNNAPKMSRFEVEAE